MSDMSWQGVGIMGPVKEYFDARNKQVQANIKDRDLSCDVYRFKEALHRINYMKNFSWAGVPIMQYPSDLMVMQELIFSLEPDYIVEVGIAFGGMTLFYQGMMQLLGITVDNVISVDNDIRPHAREVFSTQNGYQIEGSSTDIEVLNRVRNYIAQDDWANRTVLVSLDSNHTHEHVLQELKLYSPLVSIGSYIVVFDTEIEEYWHCMNQDRPWGVGNNPSTAVQEFLKTNDDFIVDKEIEGRAIITSAPGGWLRRVK
jgi:cephalosporin hydroxylase